MEFNFIIDDKEEKLKSDGGFKSPDEFVQWLGAPAKPDQHKSDPDKKKVQPKGDYTPPSDNNRRRRKPQQCSEINLED